MKIKIGDFASSEIIGAIVLLAIAISVFSVVYINVLSDNGPYPNAYVTIVGKVEKNPVEFFDVVFEHRRGESLGLDTKVILNIGGFYGDNYHMTVNDESLIDPQKTIDGWNIGERLVYHPGQDLDDVQISALITNVETNSLVFWGTLQEGYIAPPWGRGGLWHFDELFWDGTPGEVKDSSGNENHGVARNGAKIYVEDGDWKTDDIISGNCGYFDGYDDNVEVKSEYSLNITDAVTIEAWVKPLKETTVLTDTILAWLKFGYNPDLIHIYGDTYAIAARDTGGGGANKPCVVFTFNISSDGTVSMLDPSIPNNRTYFCALGDKPDIIQHAENDSLYIIAYENATDGNGAVCTLNIYENGSIRELVGSDYKAVFSVLGECYDPMIIHVSGDVYAISYHSGPEKNPGQGKLATISVDIEGRISKLSDFTFNTSGCYYPRIVKVSGVVYAIAYQSESSSGIPVGVLTTVNINPSGSLISKIGDFPFNESTGKMPYFVHISGDVYAIAYQGDIVVGGKIGRGVLTTVNISPDGSSISIIDDFIFADNSYEATLTKFSEFSDIRYFLIYTDSQSESSPGFLRTVDIENNGSIVDTAETWEPELLTDALGGPTDVLHLGGRIFAFAFRHIAEQHGHPGHIMCLALGEDPTPLHERGIVRAGAATLYAQQPKGSETVNILGCINDENQIIYAEVNPDGWYHIILTYDGSIIKLYVGSLYDDSIPLDPSAEMEYTGLINIPQNDLLFGNIFYGYIDEIAIFDRALTYDEFNFHHQNPGIFPEAQ